MSIQINGTTGISGVDGTAGSPALQGADTNTGISFGTDEVSINTGGVQRANFDGSGNIDLGPLDISGSAAADSVKIDSAGALIVNDASTNANIFDAQLRVDGNVHLGGNMTCGHSGGDYDGIGYNVGWQSSNGSFKYVVSDTAAFIRFGANSGRVETFTAALGTAGNALSFTTGPYVASGGTSWTSSSDERLKENLLPIENGLEKISSLRAVTGRFKTDDSSKSRSFLIAQDVQGVLPEAVDTTDPDSLGLDYGAVIPLLVAALKESKERIETLETKVAALEGGAL